MKNTFSQKEKNELVSMQKAFYAGKPIYHPSKYWDFLNKKNIDQLEKYGFENIKIQQAFNYFTWYVFNRHHDQFQYVWHHTNIIEKIRAVIAALLSKPFTNFTMTTKQRWQFVVYMTLLWQYVRKFDKYNLLDIPEPKYGNPLLVSWGRKKLSQDIANSVLEILSIAEVFQPVGKEKVNILELGAGYGRNAFVILQKYPHSKLFIVDIPPALLISQWYLAKVFPKKKIFTFRDFKNYATVKKEIDNADIVFFLPHQMELLPDKSINLFYTISSIHEMQPQQIKAYFQQINRLVKGIFYFKQWKVSKIPYDKIVIKQNEYPVRKSWKKLFHREAKVQSQFFEAAYKIL